MRRIAAFIWLLVALCAATLLLLAAPSPPLSAAQNTSQPTLVILGTYATPLKPPPDRHPARRPDAYRHR